MRLLFIRDYRVEPESQHQAERRREGHWQPQRTGRETTRVPAVRSSDWFVFGIGQVYC